jgi:hypothetical protein
MYKHVKCVLPSAYPGLAEYRPRPQQQLLADAASPLLKLTSHESEKHTSNFWLSVTYKCETYGDV